MRSSRSLVSAVPVGAGDAAERAAIEAEARGAFGPPDPAEVHVRHLAAAAAVASPWRARRMARHRAMIPLDFRCGSGLGNDEAKP